MNYRREIDGLRAVAVIPVILFHAGLSWFSGGYVGVDVFFVISGYLITTILISEMEVGSFSIARFYERRARRILPALFFVMLATIPFAWVLMLPTQFKDYSEGLAAVSLFVSNILFWSKEDYFAPAAEDNPLLHTWSLAVEEQFYILFPLLLLALWRYGKNPVFYAVVFLTCVSLLLSEYGWRHHPSANFYMLHSRAWELGAGAICAFLLMGRKPWSSEFLSLLGLGLILTSVFIYDETIPFPSLYALLPVVGTMLIILFSSPKTLTAKILSVKVLVGIGLISFSAYLWHQPLFAFARIASKFEPSLLMMLGLSGLSIVLAYGTWRYVEKPFREKRVKMFSSRVLILSWSGLAGVIFIAFGLYVHATNGMISRFDGHEKKVLLDSIKYKRVIRTQAYERFECFFDQSQDSSILINNNCIDLDLDGRIVLFGDSEAAHYIEGLKASYLEGSVFQWTGASCRPFIHTGQSVRCRKFLDLFFEHVNPDLTELDRVLISANWSNTHSKIGKIEFMLRVGETVEKIKSTGAQVIVIGNTPDFPSDPYGELINSKQLAKATVYLQVEDYQTSEASLMAIARSLDVPVLAPTALLCDGSNPGECLFKKDGEYLFFDQGHLSFKGSKLLVGSPRMRLPE
jgi:peptidoglycan/LPS O-acetylase OafA/YrhL